MSVAGVKTSIDNDNPSILYLFGDPDYEDHVVITYSYAVIDSLTYFSIHSGHHTDCLKSASKTDIGIMGDVKVSALLSYGGGAWLELVGTHTHNFSKGYYLPNEKLYFFKCVR